MAMLRRRVAPLRMLDALREGFAFLPSVATVLGASFCLGLLALDTTGSVPEIGNPSADQVRALATLVGGGVLGITATSFTIVMAVLTLASSQFGPRLLRQFLKDGTSQRTLAVFLATFSYHLTLLLGAEAVEAPRAAMVGGIATAIASVGALVFFIENYTRNVHADALVGGVGSDFDRILDDLKHSGPQLPDDAPTERPDLPHAVGAHQPGYLQAVDLSGLVKSACELGVVVGFTVRPGTHLLPGEELLRTSKELDESEQEALLKHIWMGPTRSVNQDLEYVLDQLSEMAVRAMSPGINDPYTAERCIHRQTEALARIVQQGTLEDRQVDAEGTVRLWMRWPTFRQLAGAVFHRTRHAAREDVSVARTLILAAARLASTTADPTLHAVCLERAEEMANAMFRGNPTQRDRDVIDEALQQARDACGRPLPDAAIRS